MRKTKYRAWNTSKEKMYYTGFGIGTFSTNGEWWEISQDDITVVNASNGKLMEYTGIKDVNGKGIYEGDIVSGFNDGEAIVKFRKGSFIFELPYSWVNFADLGGEIEVVGSIYER